ncbi:hypothetical protein ACFPRL_04565 [Pseudoclavibacter helvolus]
MFRKYYTWPHGTAEPRQSGPRSGEESGSRAETGPGAGTSATSCHRRRERVRGSRPGRRLRA